MDFKFDLNLSGFGRISNLKKLDKSKVYDVMIIGGGPAAMAASVYCMRKGLLTGLISKNTGGQVAETSGIENYMGFTYIDGTSLVGKFKEQLELFELGFSENQNVSSLTAGKIKKISLENGDVFDAKTVIIATGKRSKKLGIPGETEFTGKGVAYCAICDAPLYKGKDVAVAGGGNSGVEAAIDLAKIASRVTLIQRSSRLKADMIAIDKLKAFTNLEIMYDTKVVEISGGESVEKINVSDKAGLMKEISVQGIFIEIGLIPNAEFARDVIKLNEFGEIEVDAKCRTNVDGIFAAGDVTAVPYKQIIIAAGEGAKAALSASEYLIKN
jgi:alkyl hydroperoxide reductase subunit F